VAGAYRERRRDEDSGVNQLLLLPPAERYPRIRSAIAELEEARKELRAAPHNFGGHKETAIRAIEEAIRELREALRYAR
jgi:hypothetical protein